VHGGLGFGDGRRVLDRFAVRGTVLAGAAWVSALA